MAKPKVSAKPLAGWREWVMLPELSPVPIKAKLDTGARTSALHAFRLQAIEQDDRQWAEFEVLPVQRSRDHRTRGRLPISGYRRIRSSTGHSESRPVVQTPLVIGSSRFPIELTLTSRDEMGFRMLLGRSALRNRFWVDPARSFLQPRPTEEPGSNERTP